jgi:DNA replication protein DnaC
VSIVQDYKDRLYDELNREYIYLREENKKKRADAVARVYADLPRVRAIDEEITEIGLGVASAVLEGGTPPETAVNGMRVKMNALVREKEALLAAAGYPPDVTGEVYSCGLCRDRGYADGKRCVCYNRRLHRLMRKYSNIRMSDKSAFERFDVTLYSDKPDAKYGISPRENMKSVYNVALSFAEGAEDAPRNLLFYGATGLGKTFTSDCIAKKYIESGKTVFYMSAPGLFTAFEEYKFGRDTSAGTRRTLDSVNASELLIIDDLGTEFKTAYADSILFDIVNSRIIEEKRMIISTNLSAKELQHSYSDRICSRILGSFAAVLFFGDDLRMKALR